MLDYRVVIQQTEKGVTPEMDYFKFALDNSRAQAADINRTLEQMERDYIAPAAKSALEANACYQGDAGDETES